MQNFVRQWTKKSTGQCVRWFEKSTGQFKKPPAFVRFPVLNTIPGSRLDKQALMISNMSCNTRTVLPLILGAVQHQT